MHWRRSPTFHQFLMERQFEVLVTVRHPLDVLISILHFAQYEPATRRWLDGEGGNETSLLGADPTSEAFLAYALSGRASALFEVSAEWYGIARAGDESQGRDGYRNRFDPQTLATRPHRPASSQFRSSKCWTGLVLSG
jgi:hypothetical protein